MDMDGVYLSRALDSPRVENRPERCAGGSARERRLTIRVGGGA
ncbi:hypothetical protein DB30_01101 [Enhygromyxa salina]|uniref:Uncharacterized protein n=1 Tax=Enhygromyxa salina TaxID=215803 RepID=A0A0C1ZNY7_9BACT|nr:hypothetical protein DB30_01101 [Enhygromyxa salina]